MAHINYPSVQVSFIDGTPFTLEDLQKEVDSIRTALSAIPGAFEALLTNYQLTSGNQGVLSAALTRYNADLAGTEVPHGGVTDPPIPPAGPVDIYKPLVQASDIVDTERTKISSGLFSNGATSLGSTTKGGSTDSFFYSSTLGDVSASYIPVYNADPDSDSTAQVQFAVGYGHYGGSGSIGNTTKTTTGNRETAALYRQFRNVILGQGTDKFTFTSAPSTSEDIAFIVFNRAQMREKVDPGNWELHLSGSGYGQSGIKLIDDSSATTNTTVNSANRVFNVVSGSIVGGTTDIKTAASAETTYGAPGLFYPDLGIILLNPRWLENPNGAAAGFQSASVQFSTGSNTFGDNAKLIFNSINATSGSYFAARREEEISSTSYFCRALNNEFNFSANPTYETTDSNGNRGAFTQPTFKGDPKAYITQVGLYGQGELLAVAKLSQPILKSFSREAIIKVKLDY